MGFVQKQTITLFISHFTILSTKYMRDIFQRFLSVFYRLCCYSCPIFFSPLFPSTLYPSTSIPCPQFMPMGRTYKFFGFSISYTILNLPLFSTYHLCYLFSVPLPPLSPPTPLLVTLRVISISVVLFLFQLLAQLAFVLGVVVKNFEFAVIFTVYLFDLLFLR